MMNTLHVVIESLTDPADIDYIDSALRSVDGIQDIAAIPSIGLTSILFDDGLVDDDRIMGAVKGAGFDPRRLERVGGVR